MGRRVTVESHPQRDAIVKAVISGRKSYQDIAERYAIPKSTLCFYVKERLMPAVAKVKAVEQKKEGDAFLNRIETAMVRVQKLYDACDKWLLDSDNPNEYNLDPRASEYTVIYLEPEVEGQQRKRNKCSLQQLLDRIEASGREKLLVESKTADVRKLLLDTAMVLNKQLELLAKIQGLVKDNLNVTVNAENIYTNIIQVISNATKEFPDIRERIIGELEKSTKSITG